MHDSNDDQKPPKQDDLTQELSLSEKRAYAANVRWTRQKALELGMKLLEADGTITTPPTPPEKPPMPPDLEGWKDKIREKLWEGLLASDERVLSYLTRLLDIENQGDLRFSDDEIELIRRHRKWRALDADAQHRELEKTFEAADLLPQWRAKWEWNPAIQAWQPRKETWLCPGCKTILWQAPARGTPTERTPAWAAESTPAAQPTTAQG